MNYLSRDISIGIFLSYIAPIYKIIYLAVGGNSGSFLICLNDIDIKKNFLLFKKNIYDMMGDENIL